MVAREEKGEGTGGRWKRYPDGQCYPATHCNQDPLTASRCKYWFCGARIYLNTGTYARRGNQSTVLSPFVCHVQAGWVAEADVVMLLCVWKWPVTRHALPGSALRLFETGYGAVRFRLSNSTRGYKSRKLRIAQESGNTIHPRTIHS